MKNLLLILNPVSGKMTGKRHLADVIEKFCRAGYSPRVYVSTEPGNAKAIAATCGGTAGLVVCMGGDGTLNEVITGLITAGHTTPIGYIPSGSTNDFANSIGLKKTVQAAADNIINGHPHIYDVGKFGDRYFSYIASFGAFARTAYATPQNAKNILGRLAYVLGGITELTRLKPCHARVEIDGHKIVEGDYIFGAISNATSVGGLITIDPKAVDMNDGLLELLLIKMPQTTREFYACVKALKEQRYDTPVITLYHGSNFVITTDQDWEWTLDGECGGNHHHASIRNCPNAITIIH